MYGGYVAGIPSGRNPSPFGSSFFPAAIVCPNMETQIWKCMHVRAVSAVYSVKSTNSTLGINQQAWQNPLHAEAQKQLGMIAD
jgi:hypothetical protein